MDLQTEKEKNMQKNCFSRDGYLHFLKILVYYTT